MKLLKYFFGLYLLFFLSGCALTSTYISEDFKNNRPERPEQNQILNRIFLIGDAGQPAAEEREPVLEALETEASKLPDKSLILFLGDNIYPAGLDDPESDLRTISESRLNEQIKVVENSKSAGIFVPGNHDWDGGGELGWSKILSQAEYIRERGDTSVIFLPLGGCPGPEVLDLQGVRIIIMDTQWWLHEYSKPGPDNSDCKFATEDAILEALDNAISTAGKKFVIIASHHPLDTHGPHGGEFDWSEHLFPLLSLNDNLYIPLPVIGSLYPLARMMGISNQDLSSSAYKHMKRKMEQVIKKYDNVVWAAGHEHSLQVLKGINGLYYLISGFGTSIHDNHVYAEENTIYADDEQGFMVVDILKNGKSRLGIFQVDVETTNWVEIFSMMLN